MLGVPEVNQQLFSEYFLPRNTLLEDYFPVLVMLPTTAKYVSFPLFLPVSFFPVFPSFLNYSNDWNICCCFLSRLQDDLIVCLEAVSVSEN